MKILSHRLEIQVCDPDGLLFLESVVECLVEDKRLLSVIRYEDGCEASYAVTLLYYKPNKYENLWHIGQQWDSDNWEGIETAYFSRKYHALDCFEKVIKHFIYG